MGLCSELGIDEGMNREQIVKQLFSARKKWSLRQNGSDMQKRQEAEIILDVISSLQNAIDKSVDAFPSVQLLVQTYGCFYDNGKLRNDIKEAIEDAVSGSGYAAGFLGELSGSIGQQEIQKSWMFWAADCGFVNAYQVCGYLLMDSDSDAAIEWFEKAAQANAISVSNLYNWGVTYYTKGLYTQAEEKFKNASAQEHDRAPYLLGKMYEAGASTDRNLEMALQQYRLSKQRGYQEAQADIIRVTNLLNQQKNQQQNNPSAGSQNVQQATQQKKSKPTGQPIVAYEIKSDKKPIISREIRVIVIIICWIVICLLYIYGIYQSRSARKKISGQNVQEMMQMQEEVGGERNEPEEIALTDDTDATPADSFECEIGYDGVIITAFTGNETDRGYSSGGHRRKAGVCDPV